MHDNLFNCKASKLCSNIGSVNNDRTLRIEDVPSLLKFFDDYNI